MKADAKSVEKLQISKLLCRTFIKREFPIEHQEDKHEHIKMKPLTDNAPEGNKPLFNKRIVPNRYNKNQTTYFRRRDDLFQFIVDVFHSSLFTKYRILIDRCLKVVK